MKIMIVDDEYDVVEALTLGFQLQWPDWDVISAGDGETALKLFEDEKPDFVILDISMPEMDGFDVLRRIRESSYVPVLMLTVKGGEMDKVKALELGADDYVTKPFSSLELLARIKAVLRRAEATYHLTAEPPKNVGDLVIHFSRREVEVRGQAVKLSPTEHNLLVHLVHNIGRTLPQKTLLARAWGGEYSDALDSLKAYIWRLREKIEEDPRNPRYILTERGLGYRFVDPDQPQR
jgi:two-component system, OmpR family, KDP operon response regulator KdpE